MNNQFNSLIYIINFFLLNSCLFGFVARKTGSRTDNQCHIFSEFEIEQSASTIVNFTNKVIASSPTQTLQKSRTNQFL